MSALFVWFPFGCRSAWWLASSFGVPVGTTHNFVALWTACTLSLMIGRYFFRVPIRERLFDGDLFAHRFLWKTSTRTDSWHSDSPRRHSCLTTETGTVALFSPWRCLSFSSLTVWKTFLFGNRDRYHGFSRQWRCLRFSSSTVWRTLLLYVSTPEFILG